VQEPRYDEKKNSKECSNCGRQQAELTESFDHKSLKVEKPQSADKHSADKNQQQEMREPVTKEVKEREAKDSEISNGSDHRDGNAAYDRIGTAQNFRAACDDCAADALARNVFDGEVDGVR